MYRMHKIVPSLVLIFSALALSACATKQEVVAPAPAPVAVAAEPAATTEPAPVAEQAAPAPSVMAEIPAPKPVVKKARKHRKKVAKAVPPKVMEAEPVAAPEPAVQQEAPAAAPPQEAPAPIAMSAPAQPVEEKGFLENYWAWLLGIVIAVAALLWYLMGKKKE
jgi:outer membrane biosynthesis protein TonB